MNEIFWPEDYIPGFTDNFVSNEVIVAGLGYHLLSSCALPRNYFRPTAFAQSGHSKMWRSALNQQ